MRYNISNNTQLLAAHSAVADHGLMQNIFIHFIPFTQNKTKHSKQQQQPHSSTANSNNNKKVKLFQYTDTQDQLKERYKN